VNNDDFDRLLSDLEVRLERVRSLYEQYFIGIERLEPLIPRKDVDRRFWELRKVRLRNTALRFRFQTLVQRYNTLQQYWVRICRQIENGTYVRQLRKLARTEASNLLRERQSQLGASDAQAPDTSAHPPETKEREVMKPAGAPGALTTDRVSALHAELSAARQNLKQGNVSVESVEQRLRDATAQLEQRYPGRAVDFRVEVKDGKAVIKPFLR
jgi:hypothetical protein